MKPLQISPETAQKLAKALGVPLEHLMHTPPHILMQKLAQLSAESDKPAEESGSTSGEASGQAGAADKEDGK